MSHQKIVHLIDDTTAGGVMRAVDYLTSHPALSEKAEHITVQVAKAALRADAYDADVIVSHTTLSWRGLPGLISLRAKNPNARLIHVEHSYTRAFTALNVSRRKRFFAMLRLSYALFDQIVAVSNDQGAWLQERGLVRSENLTVIPPLVDVAPFEAIETVAASPKTIGAIGRLDRQKGFDILIAGFRRWSDPDARLLIFGDGCERPRLEELAAGDARIEFRGHVQDPATAMASVSVIAMPSRWEAYGLVCLEALAAGRTVIAASVDGLKDVDRGFFQKISLNTPEVWASTLEMLSANNNRAASPEKIDHASNWLRNWKPLLRLS